MRPISKLGQRSLFLQAEEMGEKKFAQFSSIRVSSYAGDWVNVPEGANMLRFWRVSIALYGSVRW